ncbi:MAG: Mur ligase family protein, partial [Acidimicrobiia bacterium]|nr:Mur ligase family protein [Acidimicrobiia bacterium]
MTWALAAVCGAASAPAALRWLRIAQREHYLAPATTRFAVRWWWNGWLNRFLLALGLVGLIGTPFDVRFGFLVAVAQVGPVGLSLRGRTAGLAWTVRLQRLAFGVGLLLLGFYLGGALSDRPVLIVLGLLALPILIDVVLAALAPIEKQLGSRWVDKAAAKLKASGAKVVAITGSYGKTSTKVYLEHLLSPSLRTVASPASFNNRMGLARAINEHLVPGTEVFIAEMGTYGKGEITSLCRWIEPTISAIVSIGPVHLERFRTEERIVAAKAEILDRADAGVVAIDHPLLADLVRTRGGQMQILTTSAEGKTADVTFSQVDRTISVGDHIVGPVPDGVFPINATVAVGIARLLGVEVDGALLGSLPAAEHRQTVSVSERGVSIIDDTFNSNPAGARAGIELLSSLPVPRRRVVVTPGMVELGPR